MQYDNLTPPFVPMVAAFPEAQYVLPMIAASIANEAALKANANAGRMFCYNLLVNNNWNNAEFSEVVKIIADLVALNTRKKLYHTVEAGVKDAVSQVLVLYTSELLFRHPGLKGLVSPQILNAAHQNSHSFNNLKQELASMQQYPNTNYPMQPMNQPMPQQQGGYYNGPQTGMPPPGYYPQQQYPQQQQQYPQMPQQYPQQLPPGYVMTAQGPVFVGNPNVPPAVNNYPPQSGNFGNTFGNNIHQGVSTGASFDIKQDRFLTHPSAGGRQPEPQVQQPIQQAAVQRETAQPSTKLYLEIEQGSEMERAKHQIVHFSDSYTADTRTRNINLVESTKALAKEDPSLAPETNQYVHEALLLEPCIESAIVSGRSRQFKKQSKDSSINVFRCFAAITTPILCVDEVESYMKVIREANSFLNLSVKMKALALSLNVKKEEKPLYTDNIISFMSVIDNQLVTMINGFLRNSLKLKTSITCFTEDATELHDYLYRQYGQTYSDAFGVFETEVLYSLREELNEQSVEDLMTNWDIPEGLHAALLPINHSLTFTFMTSKELGYKVKNEPLIIDKETAPTLFKIAQSLTKHKKEMGMSTVVDLLITADNVRYELHRNRTVSEEYLISRFN
jgi:hypothetical protein